MDLGFVKFKSNGTKAKRPLDRSRKHGAKKKNIFLFVFLGGFAWTFPESKWGMDFLGNQTGIAQTWESNGGCNKIKK